MGRKWVSGVDEMRLNGVGEMKGGDGWEAVG